MADTQLSNGVIQDILLGRNPPRPVLQVLNMKKIQSEQAAAERYRLQMSDGTYYQPCMLATQMNDKIHSNELDKFSIVQVERYICNTIHERKIIIIIQLNVIRLGPDVGGPIGHPQALDLVRVDPNAPPSVQRNAPGPGGPPPGGNQPGAPPYQGGGGGGRGGGGSYAGGMGRPNPSQQGYRPGNPPNAVGAGMSGPQRSYANAAPPARPGFDSYTSSQRTVFPITSLSPYQSKWTIRARVTSKPPIRTWSNSRGEGKVLSVNLLDESGEIRASCWHEAADKYAAIFEVGKVYYISRGRLKPANKQYSGGVKNDYELTINDDTDVELCTDAVGDLPTIQYNFTPIANIENVDINSFIDVVGVCKNTADVGTIITKTGNRKVSKRDIQLVDRSGRVVSCTLWGAEAEGFDGSTNPVVALKGCKVSDFGGRSLSTMFSTEMTIDPDIPEAHQLRGWFDNVGKNEAVTSISEQRIMGIGQPAAYLNIGQVKELDLGRKEKPDYFNCKASITFVKKDNSLYKACPSPDCNKKVTEGGAGEQYFCEKCNQSFPNFKYRLLLQVNIADHAGSQWVTCFQETGMEILNKSAQELGELREQDEASFEQVFQQANFKEFVFRLRAKMDTYNDEQRLKCIAMSVSPVNYAQETRRRIEEIKQMMAQ